MCQRLLPPAGPPPGPLRAGAPAAPGATPGVCQPGPDGHDPGRWPVSCHHRRERRPPLPRLQLVRRRRLPAGAAAVPRAQPHCPLPGPPPAPVLQAAPAAAAPVPAPRALWHRRLGVNGARVFTSTLWNVGGLEAWVGAARWGRSLNGTLVNTLADFQAAMATLRSPSGHDPAQAAQFATPVLWPLFEAKWKTVRGPAAELPHAPTRARARLRRAQLAPAPPGPHAAGPPPTPRASPAPAQTLDSTKDREQSGNYDATLATLGALGQSALAVVGLGAGAVPDDGALDAATPTYWQARWEVYKHVYAFSRCGRPALRCGCRCCCCGQPGLGLHRCGIPQAVPAPPRPSFLQLSMAAQRQRRGAVQ